jgi:sortase A
MLNGGAPAVSAHRETFFAPLRNVSPGDIVVITMPYGTFRYRIGDHVIVRPNQPERVYTTEGIPEDSERLVLITCYPFSTWQPPNRRIAFFAELIHD